MAKDAKIIVDLTVMSEKNKTVRYDSKDRDYSKFPVTNLYVSQEALEDAFGEFPDGVRVTVEAL